MIKFIETKEYSDYIENKYDIYGYELAEYIYEDRSPKWTVNPRYENRLDMTIQSKKATVPSGDCCYLYLPILGEYERLPKVKALQRKIDIAVKAMEEINEYIKKKEEEWSNDHD